MTVSSLRRYTLLSAVALVAASASGQYRIDNSSARDANNRIGSSGLNERGGGYYQGGLNGNFIVTGDVTAGRAFRGSLGYTSPTAFRGGLGSGSFDNFYRDSIGIGQLRQSGTAASTLNSINARPYFGPGQTVQRPTGFVRDNATGGFVAAPRSVAQPFDARIDYGGASRQQIATGALDQSTVIGGAGLTSTPFGGNLAANNLTVSDYTTIARPPTRFGVGDAAGTGVQNNLFREAQPTQSDGAPQQASSGAIGDDAPRTGAVPGSRDATLGSASDSSSGRTGQGTTFRDPRLVEANPQYAELRERLVRRQQSLLPNSENIEQTRLRNEQILRERKEQSPTQQQTPSGTPTPGAERQQPGTATPGAAGSNIIRDSAATTVRPPVASDETAPAQTPRSPDAPMEITSLATGVQNEQLKQAMTQAESLMKAGRFTSAIDTYDRAETIAAGEPFVFMGRGIAELGGSYYRNAEGHLRQAFAADRSLMLARYDLRQLLSAERLNFLIDDLGRVANANKADPGPLLLLAFVYYNTNLPDRAARALDLAQERAGGKDDTVRLLKEHWTLPTSGGNK